MATPDSITVEVVYAEPGKATVLPATVASGTSVQQAIEQCGILQRHPAIDLQNNKVGIFGRACKLDHALRDGDRVEIYRPLVADPRAARKKASAE